MPVTIIDLPKWPAASTIEWKPRQPSQVNRSEFTRKTHSLQLPGGSYWTAKVGYPTVYGEAQFRAWRSALLRLRGRQRAFRLSACEGPQHHEHQLVTVDGANQQGFALATQGWAPGSGLRDGMFVTVRTASGGEHLLGVVGDTAIAGANGKLVLQVEPNIPEGVASGSAIETRRPWGLMQMASDDIGWRVSAGQEYTVMFDCEEA